MRPLTATLPLAGMLGILPAIVGLPLASGGGVPDLIRSGTPPAVGPSAAALL